MWKACLIEREIIYHSQNQQALSFLVEIGIKIDLVKAHKMFTIMTLVKICNQKNHSFVKKKNRTLKVWVAYLDINWVFEK